MSDQAPTAEPIGILKPFTPDPDRAGRKLRRRILLGLFFLFCWFWGVAFAFLAPFLILFLLFPWPCCWCCAFGRCRRKHPHL